MRLTTRRQRPLCQLRGLSPTLFQRNLTLRTQSAARATHPSSLHSTTCLRRLTLVLFRRVRSRTTFRPSLRAQSFHLRATTARFPSSASSLRRLRTICNLPLRLIRRRATRSRLYTNPPRSAIWSRLRLVSRPSLRPAKRTRTFQACSQTRLRVRPGTLVSFRLTVTWTRAIARLSLRHRPRTLPRRPHATWAAPTFRISFQNHLRWIRLVFMPVTHRWCPVSLRMATYLASSLPRRHLWILIFQSLKPTLSPCRPQN